MDGVLQSPRIQVLAAATVSEVPRLTARLRAVPASLEASAELAAGREPFARELAKMLVPLRAFARTLIADRSLADGLVREVVSAAWANRRVFPQGPDMRVWAFRTLYTAYTAGVVGITGADETSEAFRSGTSGQGREGSGFAFHAALHRLPVDQRAGLILLEACGFGLGEAGAICGCGPATVQSLADRARERLAVMIGLQPT